MMQHSVVRVAVVESDPLLSGLLVRLLRDANDMSVTTATNTVALARTLISPWSADVLLLDVDPPNQTGLDLFLTLRDAQPELQAVLLTSGEPRELLSRVTQGEHRPPRVISKRDAAAAAVLLDVIRATVTRGPSGSLAHPHARIRSAIAGLTARQQEALRLLATGLSNAAIADALGISSHSVDNILNGTYSTLDLRSDPQLNPRVAAVLLLLEHDRGLARGGNAT